MAISSIQLLRCAPPLNRPSSSATPFSSHSQKKVAKMTFSAPVSVSYGRLRGTLVNVSARSRTRASAVGPDGGETTEDHPEDHPVVASEDHPVAAEDHPVFPPPTESVDDKLVADKPPEVQERDFAVADKPPEVQERDVAVAVEPPEVRERDFSGTAYVPVYVMLPLGIISMDSELVDPDNLLEELKILKSANIDGVMVDCWWGIVERHAPQRYNWSAYKNLFQIVRDLDLKLQVVMSFHECGGNVGDDIHIPLPLWVTEIGQRNPDIFFTDKDGRRNSECLTWGVDKERVFRGRTAVEVYFDFMRSFRVEFDEFFEYGTISEIEIGLGPCGELRYPSYPAKHGWKYPGIGEFQCYDRYLLKSLKKAAEVRGHSFWGKVPDNAGSYNSRPYDTRFFCEGGEYDGYYGRFFLNWYSRVLVDHGDRVLSLANLAFEGTNIAVKLSGAHWWYKTPSHAAELTAGFYNPVNRDGYTAIAAMLKKQGAALNFTCLELRTVDQQEDCPEAMADPEGLVWQVLNNAWDVSIAVASENALPCYDRESYKKILDNAKPLNDPDGRHLSTFTYLRLNPILMEQNNLLEFDRFVKSMHGEAASDLQPSSE